MLFIMVAPAELRLLLKKPPRKVFESPNLLLAVNLFSKEYKQATYVNNALLERHNFILLSIVIPIRNNTYYNNVITILLNKICAFEGSSCSFRAIIQLYLSKSVR